MTQHIICLRFADDVSRYLDPLLIFMIDHCFIRILLFLLNNSWSKDSVFDSQNIELSSKECLRSPVMEYIRLYFAATQLQKFKIYTVQDGLTFGLQINTFGVLQVYTNYFYSLSHEEINKNGANIFCLSFQKVSNKGRELHYK